MEFNYPEFDVIKNASGVNRFTMSVGQWMSRTRAKGFIVKAGKYGGTYAHKDIAFHFAMWLSPAFQLLVVREYQLLKEQKASSQNLEWNFRRFLTKANYRIHTEAVRDFSIPKSRLLENNQWIVYADEADLLNMAVFKFTAKEWREANAATQENCENVRDCADKVQLLVLANLESLHSSLLRNGKTKQERFEILVKETDIQLETLYAHYSDRTLIESPNLIKEPDGDFDKSLKGLLSVPAPKNN